MLVYISGPQTKSRGKEFFKDVDGYLHGLRKLTGDERDDKEQDILQDILPILEESCFQSDDRAMETYITLAKLSCVPTNCPGVIKHAQQLLLHLLDQGDTTGCNAKITKVEKILREPLITPNSVFTDAGPQQQMFRLTVYSKVLALMLIYIEQEHLIRENIVDKDLRELEEVSQKLKNLSSAAAYKKKTQLRYSAEFIREAIGRIVAKKRDPRTKEFLDECERLIRPDADVTQEPGFLKRIESAKIHWFDLHLLSLYIHNKARNGL